MHDRVNVVVGYPTALVRSLVRLVLDSGEVEVLGDTSDLADVVALARRTSPHVAVLGSVFGDDMVEDILPDLLALGTRALIMCDDPAPDRLTRVMLSGASGYLLLDGSSPDDLVHAVRVVASGGTALHPAVARAILDQWRRLRGALPAPSQPKQLTKRESEVLQAMADGMATKGIARHLNVSPKTVEAHKARIFEKLDARNHAHAVAVAISQGLIIPAEPSTQS